MPPYAPAANEDAAMYGSDQSEPAAPEEKAPDEKQPEGEPTAMVDKAVFAGKEVKPGDEFVFKVVSVQDRDVQIKYNTSPPDEKGGEKPMPEPQGDDAPMPAGMMG